MDASPKGASDVTPTTDRGTRAVRSLDRGGGAPPGRGRRQRDPARAANVALAPARATAREPAHLAAARRRRRVGDSSARSRTPSPSATIVVLNALVGFFQECRAENALLALRSLTAPRAHRAARRPPRRDRRRGRGRPGRSAACSRRATSSPRTRASLEAHLLSTNEAALTGESAPVEKRTTPVPADAPLAERIDCVFMGTSVAAGPARAEVVATGMATELGRIAHLLAGAERHRRRRCRRGSRASAGRCSSSASGIVARHRGARVCCAAGRRWRCSCRRCRWRSPPCPRACRRS